MKKLLSLLLCFAMILAITPVMAYADAPRDGVEINETNFPDEVFRNYVSSNFDSDGNGSLSDDEIANAKEIYLNESGVTSLQGVEYLTEVYYLDCCNNMLTILDVSGNTYLKYFYCEGNYLTELDVSNNTLLDTFFCGTNQLSTLDLSNNSDLLVFNCMYNPLTSLDLSNNKLLIEVCCTGDQLSTLDLSSNTALERVICDENYLTELDVSNNLALYEIYCSNNPLGSLDVSKNTELSYFVCCSNNLTELDVSHNPALETLICYYNELTTLDLSNNKELKTLWCHYNPLETLNISDNAKLWNFGCSYTGLESLDISACPLLVDAYINGTMEDYGDYLYYQLKKSGALIAVMDVDKSTEVITPITRIAGKDRFQTAIEAADKLKGELGLESFPNIVIASGTDFPDALAGAYLAIAKDAPVLLANEGFASTVAKYAKNNLAEGGTVYILGGKGAVPEVMETELEKQGITHVERLAGKDRYLTNLEILKAAGVTGKNLLICSGTGYADSLSASALGKPILLVGNSLTQEQKDFLTEVKEDMSGDFFVIGGKGAVSEEVFDEVQAYAKGTTERVAGANRFETSVAIAQRFLPSRLDTAVLAYAMNYPDGLAGGPIAYAKESPLLLVTDTNYSAAKAYIGNAGIKKVIVMGGKALISDSSALEMIK